MTEKPDPLEQDIFAWRETKDGKVFLSFQGRVVTTLAGGEAERFLARIAKADARAAQLLMAKATGNFKLGNERPVGKER